jgi:membrane protein
VRGLGRFLVELVVTSVRSFLARYSLDFAASIAYRVLFSLFPLAIVVAGVFGLVSRATGAETAVVDAIVEQLPLTEEAQDEVRQQLLAATRNLSALGLLGVLGLVWAASGMVTATRKAVNLAWDTEPRSFVRGKALDVLVALAAGLVVLLTLVLSVVARVAEDAAERTLGWIGPAAAVASWLAGLAVPTVVGFVVVASAYRLLPEARPPFRQILPAAAATAIAIALLQQGFVLYLSHFGRYDVIYGSLAAVIAFLLYVYLATAVFLFGAHVARWWPEALAASRAGT